MWAGYFNAPYCLLHFLLESFQQTVTSSILHVHLLTPTAFLRFLSIESREFETVLSHSVSPLLTFNFNTSPRQAAYTASPCSPFCL